MISAHPFPEDAHPASSPPRVPSLLTRDPIPQWATIIAQTIIGSAVLVLLGVFLGS